MPYIICVERSEDGQSLVESSKSLAERAHHPEEVSGNPRLTVDANYYLSNQVCARRPVSARLVSVRERDLFGGSPMPAQFARYNQVQAA